MEEQKQKHKGAGHRKRLRERFLQSGLDGFMTKLTQQKIERQDFVDNEIFQLMQKFLPQSKTMEWDIEVIGAVRDVIREQVVDRKKAMSEERFYPSVN